FYVEFIMSRINQTAIAKRLGLSQRAVSLALNGKAGVSDVTRQRILSVATGMGYRPNASARAIRSGRFGQVAMLNSTSTAVSFHALAEIGAVQEELSRHDLNMVYARLPDEKLVSEGYV